MEQQVAERKLKNLLLFPLQDEIAYREMQVDTSISLITQHKGTGQFFFPSKLLSAMLFRKAVLAVADSDSELAHAVSDSKCGYVVEPDNVDKLAAALLEMGRRRNSGSWATTERNGSLNTPSMWSTAILRRIS